MRAVDSIDFSYEFEVDPSLKFNFHHRIYLLCLLLVTWGLIASYFSYLNLEEIINNAVEVGKLTKSNLTSPVIMSIIYFDSFTVIIVIISGLVAQYTIRTI